MKRSIVKHGPATLTISLPAKWIRTNNLNPGDELELEEKGDRLLVSCVKGEEFLTLKEDISINYLTGTRYINAAHRKGCDELTLNYQDPSYIKKIEQCLNDEVLGYEIVNQGKEFCTIKDIPGTKFEEFETLLERIWIILVSISEEVIEALEKKDSSMLDSIISSDKRINKFTNFCIRILNKRSHPKYRNIPIYYGFLKELEELADYYKFLLNYQVKFNINVSKEFLTLLEEVNDYLKRFRKVFYKPKDSEIESLFVDSKKMYDQIAEYSKGCNEQILITFLFCINDKIRSLLPSIIEMNILN